MTLVAHLTELRNRIAKALLALLIATAVSFWWYEHGLGEFIRAPYCGLDEDLRYGGADSGGCGLLITDVFGGVFIRLKVVIALTAPDYIGFILSLLVAFGVSFEVPLIAVALNLVGILSHEVLSRSRRWIFFLTIVFAAFITPTQDPFTMLLMAGPMIVLFELAIQVTRIVDKRRAKRAALEHFHDLDDDAASPLDARPSSLETDYDPSAASTRG
jgi:Sec-independent protein secretion pathway component TatC